MTTHATTHTVQPPTITTSQHYYITQSQHYCSYKLCTYWCLHVDNERVRYRCQDGLLAVDVFHLSQSDNLGDGHDLQSKELSRWKVTSQHNSPKRPCACDACVCVCVRVCVAYNVCVHMLMKHHLQQLDLLLV